MKHILVIIILALYFADTLFACNCKKSIETEASFWPCFWDWTLRALQVYGTISAVVVALFKENITHWFRHADLTLSSGETFGEDKTHQKENVVVNRYYSKITVENKGKAQANNVRVFITQLSYAHKNAAKPEILSADTESIRWETSVDKENIPPHSSRRFDLFSILPSIPKSGQTPAIPEKMLIYTYQVPDTKKGGTYTVRLRVEADNMTPLDYTVEIYWSGNWQARREEMSNELSIGKCIKVN